MLVNNLVESLAVVVGPTEVIVFLGIDGWIFELVQIHHGPINLETLDIEFFFRQNICAQWFKLVQVESLQILILNLSLERLNHAGSIREVNRILIQPHVLSRSWRKAILGEVVPVTWISSALVAIFLHQVLKKIV